LTARSPALASSGLLAADPVADGEHADTSRVNAAAAARSGLMLMPNAIRRR
jgi:hypothetical protein